ncbi:hypothetical protein EMPS_08334 [Entomortierella parvispora]|uniref:Adhesin domain-containing protein n=1 Tax=Entomortierella parvispora TaxID=205924 RepID=A0A9P3HG52_9FUNG|nr:hypothetical protein EMPS_08334 [Entomortierella parvispora]
MGLFNKPLLPAHYDNEDVQISAELCSNIIIDVVGLARGEITILSGNEDMIHIKTSVQAKESIIKNAAALEPVQDGNRYTYTIHTPLEEKLERAVTFQVFVTIPRHLDSLESFSITGTNLSLSIGNINHTFIKHFNISTARGDTTIESFYGESAVIKSSVAGGIMGKYSVARLYAHAKSGKVLADVHLLNTDEDVPPPKVICATLHHPVKVSVDGTDLFSSFTVEAKTQCQPLDVKILLASTEQKLLGNFINFGGPTRIKLSGNYQGRIETRTHYGKITIDEPEFERIDGAVLSLPSMSDRNFGKTSSSGSNASSSLKSSSSSSLGSGHLKEPSLQQPQPHQGTAMSSRTSSSQGTAMSWDRDDPRHHQSYLNHPPPSSTHHGLTLNSAPGSGTTSRAGSIAGSLTDSRSVYQESKVEKEKQRKKDDGKNSVITREMIGTIGHGSGLIMAKNGSGDITLSLI